MGSLISREQLQEVKNSVNAIAKKAKIVYGNLDKIETIGADASKGAFISPILLREDDPFSNAAVHEQEAFGPVSTIMPYKDLEEAIELSKMGKGSLVSSIITNDDNIAKEYTINAASHHGRILILNRENAKESTGHGSPLPTLVHGGPGRAGGGEEMGGMRGIKHYLQRTAVQGTPTTLTEVTGIYQAGGAYKDAEQHPFKYHWEDIEVGMSLKTHNRTITDSDIINFSNLTWDHFYAHTDITALEGTIFEKRAAHGYFILAAAAGLFVYPNKGPVAANYGLEECRFLRPIYHNDTISVRLTCKQKIDRDARGPELPSGIVKWYAEVFDADNELVAIATVLTMVQKKNPFAPINAETIKAYLSNLKEDSKPVWGNMSPQQMLEHLEMSLLIASGEIQDFEFSTPEKIMEKVHDSLYNHKPMPREYGAPEFVEKEIGKTKYADFHTAKEALLKAYEKFENFFAENPGITTKNVVFGDLTKFEWDLFHTKHMNHHFEQFGLIKK